MHRPTMAATIEVKQLIVAKQRSPITNKMLVSMEKLAFKSPRDPAILALFDLFHLIQITGFRVAEYAQTTQSKIVVYKYLSRNRANKAFILPTDWVIKNDKG